MVCDVEMGLVDDDLEGVFVHIRLWVHGKGQPAEAAELSVSSSSVRRLFFTGNSFKVSLVHSNITITVAVVMFHVWRRQLAPTLLEAIGSRVAL